MSARQLVVSLRFGFGVERGRLDRSGPHHAAAHPHPQPTSPLSTPPVIAVVKVIKAHLL